MLKDRWKRKNFFLVVLLALILTIVPASFVQAESATVELNDSDFVMENVAGKPSIIASNLPEGAIVKVYDQNSGGKLIGSSIVKTGQISAIVSTPDLNKDVYVSVTLESVRTMIAMPATGSLEDNSIIIVNNARIADTVTVTDLAVGDIVKVYKAGEGGKLLGTATVAKGKTEAVVSIVQLGTADGDVDVTLTSIGRKESERFPTSYLAELRTDKPENNYISVVNNSGIADTVTVTDLAVGDIVKVYKAGEGGKLLGTAMVAKGKTEAVVKIPKLPTPAESFDITLTSIGKTESERLNIIDYDAEPSTDVLTADGITVINNAGIADTVTVAELEPGDIVKVYDDADGVEGRRLLGTATVAKGKTEAVMNIPKLPSTLNIYVTLTSIGKTESPSCLKSYDEETKTYVLESHNIIIVNNAGLVDTVKVTDGDISIFEVGDIIKVYDANVEGNLLGKATVVKGKTETAAVVSIRQLPVSGSVWVTITSKGKQESDRCERTYESEARTLETSMVIEATNNLGKNDMVKVTGQEVGDIIKVYNAEVVGNLLGSAVVVKGKTETAATVNIRQLGAASGSVWVTVTRKGKLESIRIEKNYDAEGSTAVPVSNVAVKTAPIKVTYTAGESLDLTGLVVTLTKSDASTQDVAFANFAANGITTVKANGAALVVADTAVVITVNGKTANQAITVNVAAVTVSSVAVKTAPTKVTYTAGENLDLTGLVVTLTKSDASTEDVAFADFAANGITTVKANGSALVVADTAVVITVNGKTANQVIVVT